MSGTYDSRCYELAELFLSDTPQLATAAHKHQLALAIQQAIEDYIAGHEPRGFQSNTDHGG